MYITFPKNSYLYRGTDLEITSKIKNYKPVWFTPSLEYACLYARKLKSVIHVYKIKKKISLIDVTKIKLSLLSKQKDIKIGNQTVSIYELYKIIFGRNHKKSPLNLTYEDLENNNYSDTQIVKFYNLTKELGRHEPKLKFFKNISKLNRKRYLKKNEFNRISDIILDSLFLENLKKQFPTIDGYYAPDIQSDWSLLYCKKNIQGNKPICFFSQSQEIALFNNSKIILDKTVKKGICKYLIDNNNS